MAKYTIRDPRFAVHLEKIKESRLPNGKLTRSREQDSKYFGEMLELTDAEAMAHLHKLAPADEAAQQLFADFYATQEADRRARNPTPVANSQAGDIAAAVVQALAQAGVVRGAKTTG